MVDYPIKILKNLIIDSFKKSKYWSQQHDRIWLDISNVIQ